MDSEDEEHSPSEFYYPDETNDENTTFKLQASCEILKGPDVFELDNEENKNSQAEIEEFNNAQKAKNTVTKTKSDMKVFQRYLGSINQDVNFSLPKPCEPKKTAAQEKQIHQHSIEQLLHAVQTLLPKWTLMSFNVWKARLKNLVSFQILVKQMRTQLLSRLFYPGG